MKIYTTGTSNLDINGDGKINMYEIGYTAIRFGITPNSPNWDSRCDFVSDSKINMKDIGLIAKYFGNII